MRKKAERSRQSGAAPCSGPGPHCRKMSMKKMNKVAAAVLAVAMVGSMAMPAFAVPDIVSNFTEATISGDAVRTEQSAKTKLTYTIPESYKWSIPTEITFTKDDPSQTKLSTVSVSECYINKNSVLNITIEPLTRSEAATTGDRFVLDSAEGAEFTYDVKKMPDSTVLNKGDTVVSITGGQAVEKTQQLHFEMLNGQEDDKKTAGKYEGFVKFIAKVTSGS